MANFNNNSRVGVNVEGKNVEATVLKLHRVVDTNGDIWMVTGSQSNINKHDIGNGIECGEYGMGLEIFNRLMRGEKIPLNTSISFFKNCHYDGDLDFTEIHNEDANGEGFEGVGYVNEQGLFIHPELLFKGYVLETGTMSNRPLPVEEIATLIKHGRLELKSVPVGLRGLVHSYMLDDGYPTSHVLGDHLNNMGSIINKITRELAGTEFRIEFLLTDIKWVEYEYSGLKFNPIFDFQSADFEYDDDEGYEDASLSFIHILGMLDEAFTYIGYYVDVLELDMNHIKFQLRGHGATRVHDIIVTYDGIKCGDKELEFDLFSSRNRKLNMYMMISYLSMIIR